MGLLDDAIREHLELKRRRGADPSDIERAEREALGPVRRAPETLEASESDVAVDPGAPAEYEYEPSEEPYAEEPYAEGPYAEEPPVQTQPAPYELEPEEFGYEESEVAAAAEPEPASYAPPEPEPAPEPYAAPEPYTPPEAPAVHEPAQRADEGPGGETVEYRLEDHPELHDDPELEEEPQGEDVLEETPEFLQDTPEHDRLWFEQRPPRDFDFDN